MLAILYELLKSIFFCIIFFQSRAKQLYDAGFKNLQLIAKATEKQIVEAVDFMNGRVARQIIAASKLLLLEKVETLRGEAQDVLDSFL